VAHQDPAGDRYDSPNDPEMIAVSAFAQRAAKSSDLLQKGEVGAVGFEPTKT